MNPNQKLKISEMFFSLQGEGSHSGLPCTFVRTTGCPLRCTYCDTAYAFHGGEWKTFEQILNFAENQPTKLVQITGGEPLAQKGVWDLIDLLAEKGFQVLLETSGAISVQGINAKCHIVMDLKTPGSGESEKNLWENLDHLKPTDEIKWVITSKNDWTWVLNQLKSRQLESRFLNLISTDFNQEHLRRWIAEEILKNGLNVRFQTQLHKIIWGDEKGK